MTAPSPPTTPAVSASVAAPAKRRKPFALAWPLAVLALLLVFNLFANRSFFVITYRDGRLFGSLIDVLNRGSPVALLALGMTLVIATGGIDLSVGAVMAMAGAVAGALLAPPDGSPLAGLHAVLGSTGGVIFAGLLLALVAGMWNGMLASFLEIQPIVATLILMVSGRGIAQLLTAGQIPTFTNPSFQFLGSGSFLALPFPFVLVPVIAADNYDSAASAHRPSDCSLSPSATTPPPPISPASTPSQSSS